MYAPFCVVPTLLQIVLLQLHVLGQPVQAAASCVSNKADFLVNGTSIPDVDFDVGDSFAGLLPISTRANETRKLFFWYFPSPNPAALDEITIWLNGGPGASSLEGLLQENGPFLWQYGTWKPVPNPWSWTKLTNVVWIEQPVGTGFSQGAPSAVTEQDASAQLMGFWHNFVNIFDLIGRKVFITGESYAGVYVPHLADAMLSANDPRYFNVEAMMMYDPLLNNNAVMRQIAAVPFLDVWSNLFGLNETFTKQIHAVAAVCGYQGFIDAHLHYPPRGPIPAPPGAFDPDDQCDVWDSIIDAATLLNPCFNIYHITDGCPLPWDVLGFPGNTMYSPMGAPPVYFNRTDVQCAIHAPLVSWAEASPVKIFNTSNGLSTNYNHNQFPCNTDLLSRVADRLNHTVIGHGLLDFILLKNGTLLSIQNTTWRGAQGFQAPIEDPFVVPAHANPSLATQAGYGIVGRTHSERGLTFFDVRGSGHMIPQYAPAAAYRSLEFLLGRIPSLSSTLPFSA